MALTDSIVAYWKFDESSGNVADSVGSKTLTNNGTITYGAGKINNEAQLSGTQYFDSASPVSTATSNFSYAFWVDLASTSLDGAFFHNGSRSGDGNGYTLGVGGTTMDNSGNNLILLLDAVAWVNTADAIGTGYHHIGLTYDGTTWRFYIDGTETATSTQSGMLTPTASFSINIDVGGSFTRQTSFDIDEFGVWERVLTATEISELYNSGAGLTYPFTTSAMKDIIAPGFIAAPR